MYLKKLIGAFTALIMTVTVFAGFTVTANAEYYDNNTGTFGLNFQCGEKQWSGSVDDIIEFFNYVSKGYVFTHDTTEYIVTEGTISNSGSTTSADVTVSEAVTLDIPTSIEDATINVTSNTVGSYMNGDYVTAKDATVIIYIKAHSGHLIISVTIDGSLKPVDANATSWVDTYTMNADATLGVTFAGTHSITVNSSEHGAVNVSPTTAKEGDTITVYPIPSEGYRIASLTYTTENGNESVDIKNQSGSYTFEMPDADVTINATFELIPVYPKAEATHKGDYADSTKGDSASLWEGTLVGQGTAYCPKVTVTLNNEESKEAIGQTTVDGDSSVTIAVVVDKIKKDIKSVMLEGVANGSDISQTFPIEEQDTVNKEVDQ